MSGQVARLGLKSFQHEPSPEGPDDPLSPREREVSGLPAKGLLYADVATELGSAPRTVNTYTSHIYAKLHGRSAAGAVGKLLGSAAGRSLLSKNGRA
jgi:DNA-binding NarL/FixJ family response regulator